MYRAMRYYVDYSCTSQNDCLFFFPRFKTNSNLQIHINAVHKKEKSCVCDICGKSLSTKGGLKSHRALHSGERPYLCPHCPKTCVKQIYFSIQEGIWIYINNLTKI